jgi:hypothetical protein
VIQITLNFIKYTTSTNTMRDFAFSTQMYKVQVPSQEWGTKPGCAGDPQGSDANFQKKGEQATGMETHTIGQAMKGMNIILTQLSHMVWN